MLTRSSEVMQKMETEKSFV